MLVDVVHPFYCILDASCFSQFQDGLDLLNRWCVADVQDELFSDGLSLTSEVTSLDVVDSLTHITIGDEEQCFEGLLSDFDTFPLDHSLEIQLHLIVLELAETQYDASTLNGLDDLGGSVAAEHKPCGFTVVADDHSQGMLSPFRQAVSLIQHDDLGLACPQGHFLLRERLDLLPHHVNPPLIRCIQLQRGLLELSLQQLPHDAEHTRCLAHSWRTGQDEVRNGALGHTGTQGVNLLHISINLIEGLGAVLLQPDLFHGAYFIISPIQTAISTSKQPRMGKNSGKLIGGIIVLAIVILMMQGSEKQSQSKMSPLYVDTEFVPTNFPFFTLYNRTVSDIPGVLPYSPEQTFQQLQSKLSSSKLPPASFASSIKDYKIQAYRKHILGDELELAPDGTILQPRGQSQDNQSKDRCEICCVMLASKNEVLRLQIQRREEKYMQEQILAELNHKFKSKLRIGDISFNSLSFSTASAPGIPSNIIYDPTPVTKLSELILANERVSFLGIDIITNRVSASMLFNQEDQVVSVIDVQSGRLLRISDLKGVQFMLEYQKIKQYRVEEVLEIIGVENAKAKGLKVMEKVFKPTELIYTMNYFYDDNALINFLDAVVVDQNEVFIQAIKDLPLLSESEFSTLTEKQQGKIQRKMNCMSLFCSELQLMPEKNLFRPSYHVINKYIRNYFTHSNNYIKDTIYARFTKGLYYQLANLPTYEGKVYRKVNYELTHKKKDVIDFSGFVVATPDQTLLSFGGIPLYNTRSTIVTIISKTGKKIGSESSFSNLWEVIFLPFTKFIVADRTQSGNNIFITLQQCTTEKNQPSSNVILWLQQKSNEAKKIYQQNIYAFPASIRLQRLQTTQQLIDWIGKNQRYVQSQSTNIIVITNMFRIQSGRQNPNAGAEAILAGRQRLPRASYIVYVGVIENALKILAKNKINPQQLYLTKDPNELAIRLYKQFNPPKKKIAPTTSAYRFPKQDWLDFFPQLQQPIYGEVVPLIKPKQKEKMEGFGPNYPYKSLTKQKDYNMLPQQENAYQLAGDPPVKAPRLINQPKPFPAPCQPLKSPQKYNEYLANQPKKAQFSQPMKPSSSVSAIYAPAYDDDDHVDSFKVQKGLAGTKNGSQSNLYKFSGPMNSKIGLSIVPGASAKFGKP